METSASESGKEGEKRGDVRASRRRRLAVVLIALGLLIVVAAVVDTIRRGVDAQTAAGAEGSNAAVVLIAVTLSLLAFYGSLMYMAWLGRSPQE